MCRQEIENLKVEKSNEIHIMNHRKDLKKKSLYKNKLFKCSNRN